MALHCAGSCDGLLLAFCLSKLSLVYRCGMSVVYPLLTVEQIVGRSEWQYMHDTVRTCCEPLDLFLLSLSYSTP
jgi:hypothetical protein